MALAPGVRPSRSISIGGGEDDRLALNMLETERGRGGSGAASKAKRRPRADSTKRTPKIRVYILQSICSLPLCVCVSVCLCVCLCVSLCVCVYLPASLCMPMCVFLYIARRSYGISDLHADFTENMEWLADLPKEEYATNSISLSLRHSSRSDLSERFRRLPLV